MPDLMERLKHALGIGHAEPRMSDEQSRLAERQKRIELRQNAIDIQAEVLAADRRDLRRAHR